MTYAGKGTSKVYDHSAKKTPQSAAKGIVIQSPLTRKPLSPVSSTVLSKANIKNSQKLKNIQNAATKPILPESEILIRTPPSKPIAGDEENWTPNNMGPSVPSTPLTVPMLTVATPDTSKAAAKIAQSSEYSFEELRAGFVAPKTHAQ